MRKQSGNKKSGGPSSFKPRDKYKAHYENTKPPKRNANGDDKGSSSAGEERPFRASKPFARKSDDTDRPKRSFDKPFGERDKKPFSDRPKRSFDKSGDREEGDKPFRKSKRSFEREAGGEGRPFKDRSGDRDSKSSSDRPKRSFDKPGVNKFGDRKDDSRKPPRDSDRPSRGESDSRPFKDRPKPAFDKDRKPFSDRPKRNFDQSGGEDRNSRPFSDRPKRTFDKPGFRKDADSSGGDRKPKRDFERPNKPGADSRPFRDRPQKSFDKPAFDREGGDENIPSRVRTDRPVRKEDRPFKERAKSTFTKKTSGPEKERPLRERKESTKPAARHDDEDDDYELETDNKKGFDRPAADDVMPLNKYIAHSGECSRRDAAEMVRQGKVKVNEELILDPGHKVTYGDKVTLSGKKLTPQKGMVYILLNKPKGFITTNDDPQGRRTVMDLVGNSGVDRLFPVGRLDRATTGLLLITNDGDLTQRLSHPAYNIKKVYHVTLDKPLTKADFDKIMEGVELEDGKAIVDEMAYLEKKTELGLEIHSGKNRIVRRIFESQGYVVEKLDRVMYAGLTKKNLPRSKWRYLDEREIVLLKHFKN